MDGPAKNAVAALNAPPRWGAVGTRQEFLSGRRLTPFASRFTEPARAPLLRRALQAIEIEV